MKNVRMLFTHLRGRNPIKPRFVVVRHPEYPSWGVALVIDGWYSTKENAEGVIEVWQSRLNEVLMDIEQ